MEIEFKYQLPSLETGLRILAELELMPRLIRMDAKYYDTPDRMLRGQDITLRLRQESVEDGESRRICCCKAPGGRSKNPALKRRVEIECEAQSISEGIDGVIGMGCEQAQALRQAQPELMVVAGFSYLRREAEIDLDGAKCAVCVDVGGFLKTDGELLPFAELEIELLDGKLSKAEKLVKKLVKKYDLSPQPLSKYARALSAAKKEQL